MRQDPFATVTPQLQRSHPFGTVTPLCNGHTPLQRSHPSCNGHTPLERSHPFGMVTPLRNGRTPVVVNRNQFYSLLGSQYVARTCGSMCQNSFATVTPQLQRSHPFATATPLCNGHTPVAVNGNQFCSPQCRVA